MHGLEDAVLHQFVQLAAADAKGSGGFCGREQDGREHGEGSLSVDWRFCTDRARVRAWPVVISTRFTGSSACVAVGMTPL